MCLFCAFWNLFNCNVADFFEWSLGISLQKYSPWRKEELYKKEYIKSEQHCKNQHCFSVAQNLYSCLIKSRQNDFQMVFAAAKKLAPSILFWSRPQKENEIGSMQPFLRINVISNSIEHQTCKAPNTSSSSLASLSSSSSSLTNLLFFEMKQCALVVLSLPSEPEVPVSIPGHRLFQVCTLIFRFMFLRQSPVCVFYVSIFPEELAKVNTEGTKMPFKYERDKSGRAIPTFLKSRVWLRLAIPTLLANFLEKSG